jgi:catechol 2,3-dioxygenase-like lactoylglutathione lyase family enzyme
MLKDGQFGRIAWTEAEITEHEREQRPRFNGLAHVSLPVRDLAEARRFYEEVLGGRVILHHPGEFVEVIVAGTIFGFSEMRRTPDEPGAEYPHVAFYVDSDQFVPMKQWLEEHGVKTHQIWTRGGVEALMYFKDPSGNLFEIYCKNYQGADRLPRTSSAPNIVDFASLSYDWKPGIQ